MRPAAWVLIAAGTALVLGPALLVSFVWPIRSSEVHTLGGSHVTLMQNIYGQSLLAIEARHYTDTAASPPVEMCEFQMGPYRNGMREDEWTVEVKKAGSSTGTTKHVWYVHGKAVSKEEWEKR
jgi:hypothetical protein